MGSSLASWAFFVKAAIAALKAVPAVNAEIDGDTLVYKNHYDIGVAVGTDKGLVVPVIRDADGMDLAGVEKAIGEAGKKGPRRRPGPGGPAGGHLHDLQRRRLRLAHVHADP